MELRQLRCFVTVAELQHFGRAAERLHVVQPAVSQQVARLERELGIKLFDRSRRRATLSADGEAFLPHARQVLAAAERAAHAAADLAAGSGGLLRLGSSEALGPRLRTVLAALQERWPGTVVELVSGRTPQKLAAVAAGELDAAFVRAAEPHPGVAVHLLWDEPLVAAVAARHTGAGRHARLTLSELASLPLARAERADNPGVFDRITAACRTAGFTPPHGPAFDSIQDLLAGPVAEHRCWTLLYATTPGALVPDGVALRPTDPEVTVPTGLAVAAAPRAVALRLLAVLRDVVNADEEL